MPYLDNNGGTIAIRRSRKTGNEGNVPGSVRAPDAPEINDNTDIYEAYEATAE
jgi:hypothetical protein